MIGRESPCKGARLMRYTALEREVEFRKVTPEDSAEDINRLFHTSHALQADHSLRRFWLAELLGEGSPENPKGELFLAVSEGVRLIGGAVFYDAENTRGCPYFDKPNIASIGPFAVMPEFQGHGLGGALLQFIEDRARETGAEELALDIPPEATQTLQKYLQQGYRFAENARWPGSDRRCVILSKRLV
jgi:GNAT superfamily N-acetyltransferase